jgi:NAD(P)-dependent dehydrogenase (short-subunit alcohol dehydrogenase family)
VVVNDAGVSLDGQGRDPSIAAQVVEEIRAAGGIAEENHDDVATAEGANAIVSGAVATFGRVDILVNNAGTARDASLVRMEEEAWDSVLAVHLRGTFLCTRAFAAQAIAQGGGGRIVNTTGLSGMLGNFGQANTSAAKAGIYGLTRTASIELQRHRISVNALAPIAKTRLTEDLPMFQGVDSLTPEHVAPGMLFLASDLCGDRTGFVLAIAGARVYSYKLVETRGRFKENDGGVWTAAEIAEHWTAIVRP